MSYTGANEAIQAFLGKWGDQSKSPSDRIAEALNEAKVIAEGITKAKEGKFIYYPRWRNETTNTVE